MADDKKTPLEEAVGQAIDQALDLFVYAPLGLALTARDQLPSLIERGRKQVNQQTALAKMMGQYAVKEGEKRVRERIENVAGPPTTPAARNEAKVPASPAAPPSTTPEADTATSERAPTPAEPHASNGKAAVDTAPKPTADHLAIPGYDTLSASQVVQRLPGLSAEELVAVQSYEEATRGRRTILTKIGQLQS